MIELTQDLNWLAVIVGAVAAFILGWLWYSPTMFGEKWAAGNGIEMGTAADMPWGAMTSQVIGLLLLSWFVGVMAASQALATATLGVVAFTVLGYSGGQFAKSNGYVLNTNAGYWLASYVVMVVVQMVL